MIFLFKFNHISDFIIIVAWYYFNGIPKISPVLYYFPYLVIHSREVIQSDDSKIS